MLRVEKPERKENPVFKGKRVLSYVVLVENPAFKESLERRETGASSCVVLVESPAFRENRAFKGKWVL